MLEITLSEALKLIKYPKTIAHNSCKNMNYDKYDNVDLNQNENIYDFKNSYYFTEPVFDEKKMELI